MLWVIATLPYAVADLYEGATVERPADDPSATSRSRQVAAIVAAPFVIGGLWQLGAFTDPEIRSMQLGDREAAEWIAANLPEDAVVGSFDAGVIGYFAERPVVNLDGLVNSFEWYDARQEGTEATAAFLRDDGVTHIANHGDPVDGDEPGMRAADRLAAGRRRRRPHGAGPPGRLRLQGHRRRADRAAAVRHLRLGAPRRRQVTDRRAVLFTGTSFLAAFLLFLVQPMVAKLVLPAYGGSAAVWNTSNAFFQTALLGGYAYSHVLTRRVVRRRQAPAHLLVLALPLAVLPLALPEWAAPPEDRAPALWLVLVLTVAIGLPFFAVATSGPLLQRWFSHTDHPKADDPYFLYAAGNVGSFSALLLYPVLLEPNWSVSDQARGWAVAYVAFAILVAACGLVARPAAGARHAAALDDVEHVTPAPAGRTRLRWVVLAAIPASLMLGVTSFITGRPRRCADAVGAAAVPLPRHVRRSRSAARPTGRCGWRPCSSAGRRPRWPSPSPRRRTCPWAPPWWPTWSCSPPAPTSPTAP